MSIFRLLLCLLCIPIDLITAFLYLLILLKQRIWGKFSYADVKYSKQPVIVMIHGSGADERQFILARYLLRDLPIATINLKNDRSRSIEQYSQDLSEFIDQLEVESVILMGMSLGGLVASHYAEDRKIHSPSILGVVTIGTPFQGGPALNYVGRYMQTLRHQQMTPGSDFLLELNKKISSSSHSYLTIGSRSDLHVPDEYSRPSTPPKNHSHVTFNIPGHITLTIYPVIFTHHLRKFYGQLNTN